MSKTPRPLLVDANNVITRAIIANVASDLKADGRMTGGIFFAVHTLGSAIEFLKAGGNDPSIIIACFDDGVPAFRLKCIPEYKANRASRRTMDPEVHERAMSQLPQTRKLWATMGVHCISCPKYEADDLLWYYSNQYSRPIVMSTDKDLFQCVAAGADVFDPYRHRMIGERQFKDALGIDMRYYVLYRAMVGDASDNIAGVPGLGPKRVLDLIKQTQPNPDKSPLKQWEQVYEAVFMREGPLAKWEQSLLDCYGTVQRVIRGISLAMCPAPSVPVPTNPGDVDNLSMRRLLKKWDMKSLLSKRAASILTITSCA